MKGDAKKLQAQLQNRQAWTDHIMFVGEATEDAPVITVGRERGFAIIGSGTPGEDVQTKLQELESRIAALEQA